MRVIALLFLSSAAFSQTGAISGKIADEFGVPVDGAAILATNAKQEFRTTSTATGEYTLDKLQPGTYEVTVTAATMKNFAKKDLAISGSETLRLDVTLLQMGLGTLGDGDRFTVAAYRRTQTAPPSGPVPRLPDGTPDLSGYWFQPPSDNSKPEARPEPPDALPWAEAIRRERQASNMRDLPDSRCLPGGFEYAQGKFVHTPSILVLVTTGGFQPPRQIFLDGREHPKELNPTWLGHSVGHWEGDTLVIDTVGFNGLGWIYGGLPATELLHTIERFRRTDLGHMEIQITMDDPPVLRMPWTLKRVLNLDPNGDVEEEVCENEKDYAHMVGK